MNAGSSVKKMPGLSVNVKVVKSADTSGMAASVFGRVRTGRARKAICNGASKMLAARVAEYRSEICAGSKPLSATGNA